MVIDKLLVLLMGPILKGSGYVYSSYFFYDFMFIRISALLSSLILVCDLSGIKTAFEIGPGPSFPLNASIFQGRRKLVCREGPFIWTAVPCRARFSRKVLLLATFDLVFRKN